MTQKDYEIFIRLTDVCHAPYCLSAIRVLSRLGDEDAEMKMHKDRVQSICKDLDEAIHAAARVAQTILDAQDTSKE